MERVTDLLVEATLHGVITALAVELLIRRLPVQRLATRARLRMAALVLPIVSVPLFAIVLPMRADPAFADVCLLSSARWDAVTVFGAPVRTSVLVISAVLGLVILLRDAIGDAAHAFERRRRAVGDMTAPWLQHPRDIVGDVSRAIGVAPPIVVPVDRHDPLLLCRGVVRPSIAISEAVVKRLRPEGLRAALAHELSHVRHGDPLRDIALATLRTLQWFNPVAQVVARRITQETEWRADDEAVVVTGNAPALARALLESVRARGGDFLGAFGRARIAALEIRCRRVLSPPPEDPQPGLSPLEWMTAGLAVATIVMLVR